MGYQRTVVKQGVKLKGAGVDVVHGTGDLGIPTEPHRLLDQTCGVELVNDSLQVILFRDGDDDSFLFPAKGQHVAGTLPDPLAQETTDHQNDDQPHTGDDHMGQAKQAVTLFIFRTALGRSAVLHILFFLFFVVQAFFFRRGGGFFRGRFGGGGFFRFLRRQDGFQECQNIRIGRQLGVGVCLIFVQGHFVQKLDQIQIQHISGRFFCRLCFIDLEFCFCSPLGRGK